jgi:hypothetical protein
MPSNGKLGEAVGTRKEVRKAVGNGQGKPK